MKNRMTHIASNVALSACVMLAAGCGSSQEDAGGGSLLETRSQQSVASNLMVVEDHPLGWGYDSQTGLNTGGTCLEPVSTPVTVQANNSHMNVTFNWSNNKEEAITDVIGNLSGDVDFGIVSAELSGAYDATFSDIGNSQALTIGVKVQSVSAEHNTGYEPHQERCKEADESEAAFAQFLQNCGDRFIKAKQMGGYVFFIGGKSELTESSKQEISGSLDVDFSLGEGGLSGSATIIENLIGEGFEFRVVIVGFPELITQFSQNPDDLVPDAQDVLDALDQERQLWEQDANTNTWPGNHYGAVIGQTIAPYQPTFYENCTGLPAGEAMQCYPAFFEDTQSYMPRYEQWLAILKLRLENQTDYYWGYTSTQAQDNKDAHADARDVITSCMQRIEDRIAECGEIARTPKATDAEICAVCNANTIDHCDDSDDNGVCNDDVTEVEKCSHRNLESIFDSLAGVVPVGDAPDYGAIPVANSQHQSSASLYPTNTHICTLAGLQGKLYGGGESVRMWDNGGNWTISVSSMQGDDEGETLRGYGWCQLTSAFFDSNGNNWTTHPDLTVSTAGGTGIGYFVDANSNYLDPKYATALNGVKGRFEGGGEWAKVEKPNTSPMRMRTASQQTTVTGYASAFGLDNPVGGTIAHGGVTDHVVGTQDKPQKNFATKLMIPVDDGLCYLKEINGDFDGGGEHIRIVQKDGFWQLRAKAACTDHDGLFGGGDCNTRKWLQGKASCYLYDQTQ